MKSALNLAKFIQTNSNICLLRLLSSSTIYSLSSGYGKCGVSVIRVSGPQTKQALQSIIGHSFEPKERHATLKGFYDPESKEMIDRGLVLWFPGPASFTGEDCCEFQVHGSLAVIAAMLDALGKLPGLRAAKPGEFTKRAFFGGKLDLTEVDGLADLIHAETEAQRKQALLQSRGALSRIYDDWRRRLIRCAAHLEAYIDFAEDENIEDNVVLSMQLELQRIVQEIQSHLDDQRKGEMLRDGVRTVIIGAPNVGKSSFLNMISQRQVSIVTPLAGTTRDVIETTHNFGGYPVVFSDTAGLRQQTSDVIEQEGIERAKQCIETSNLVLLIMDARDLLKCQVRTDTQLVAFTQQYAAELGLPMETLQKKKLQLIANKIDLLTTEQQQHLAHLEQLLLISCTAEQNPNQFLRNFQQVITEICGEPSPENPRITQARYRQQLQRCIEYINIYLSDYTPDVFPDMAIAAQKLRLAVKCIERITGHVSTDDILDVVFRDFCIGK